MLIASTFEITLLSFALGDKINTYKKERLAAVLEKEQLLTEQNVMLERKVKNRTEELDTTLNELKSTQSQLVQSEKMASIGLLTAGIAHEINNPLNYMLQNVEILKEDMVDVKGLIAQYEEVNASNVQQKIAAIGHFKKKIQLESIYQEIDRSLADIADGIHRTETITQGLKTFSRLDESNYKETNIEENIDNTLQFIKHELTKNKILIKKVYGETRNVGCNPGKLNQVFMNLFINAIYAIKARADKTIPGQLEVKTEIVGAKFVISVKDNGCGMSEKTKSKLFDPFYTTKDVGEGTGLGMSIVHGIILDHKGSIHVESILNKGSKISIHLPLN
jgi:signal transduction histidine kinase